MTTIAWDGEHLAVDSQASRPITGVVHCDHCDGKLDHGLSYRRKIFTPAKNKEVLFNGQCVIAVAGAGEAMVIDTYRVGILNNVPVNVIHQMAATGKAVVLVVVTTETVWEVENTQAEVKVKEIVKAPYAVGSGSAAAMLAMKRLNRSAMAAVACAIDVDKYSGGAVRYLACRDETVGKVESYTYTDEDIVELFNDLSCKEK